MTSASRTIRRLKATPRPSRRRLLVETLENRSLLAAIASDGFESGNFLGGTGFGGAWMSAGDATVISTSAPHTGTRHAQLRSSTGDLQRAVDMSGLTDVHLQFWSKVNSLEGSDKALVSVSPNGSTWTTLLQLNKNQSDNQYHAYDLSVPTSGSTLYVRFDAAMNAADDYWFLDDIAVVGTPVTPNFPEGLVSWWTAENTTADPVSGNNGTLVSGATYAAGQIGTAFRFDGVDDRVVVADSPSLKLTQSMTIEGWVRVDSVSATSSGQILFRGDDRGGLDPYALYVDPNGTIRFLVTPSNNQGVSIGAPVPVGTFFHVVATLDDATGSMRLYLNSVLVADTITTARPFGDLDPASNPGIGIGNHGGYPSTPHNFPFRGLIDELKVYNRALSTSEVQASFNSGKGALQPVVSVSSVTSYEGDERIKYQGNFVSQQEGGLTSPYSMIYGPDGHVYVSTLAGSSVLRYDAATGAPLPAPGKPGAEFVSPGAGGLQIARSLSFGPGGNLYVVSENSDAVLRFDSVTGEPLSPLVPSGSGGLDQPRGLLFHTDGYLYVTSVGGTVATPGQDSILRYDAITGAPAGISEQDATFVATGSGGLDNPSDILFENGSFYVASTSPSTSNSVLKFAADGSFLEAFVPTGSGGLAGPADIVFHGGYLYVASWTNNTVLRYDGVTGAFAGAVASSGGLATPLGLLFEPGPSGDLLVASRDSNEIRRYSDANVAVFTINLSAPFPQSASVYFATADGTAEAGSDYSPVAGTVSFAPGETTRRVAVPIQDDADEEPTERFFVNLSSPSGAVIGTGQGTGTILDDELVSYMKFSSTAGYGDYVSMGDIAHDALGNTYIAGRLESPNSGDTAGPLDFDLLHDYADGRDLLIHQPPFADTAFIVKYDTQGKFQWVRGSTSLLDSDGQSGSSDSGTMTMNTLEIGPSGNVYFTGNYTGSVAFGGRVLPWSGQYNGNGDRHLGMIDPAGNVAWLKGYNFAQVESGGQLAVDEANNRVFLVGQQMLTNPGIPSAVVAAFNVADAANVTIAWQTTLQPKSTNGNDSVNAGDIVRDQQGNLVVVGRLIGEADFDPSGGTLSLKSSSGRFDRSEAPFVWKLTPQGQLVWALLFSGGKATADRVAVDSANQIYVAGSFSETVDFQWGTATLNLTSTGLKDAYVAKLTPSGATVYAKKYGGSSDDFLSDMLLDAQGNIYVSMTHWSSADVSTGASILKLNNSGILVNQVQMSGRIAQFSRTVSIALAPDGKLQAIGSFLGPLDIDGDGIIDLIAQDTGYAWQFDAFWILDVGL